MPLISVRSTLLTLLLSILFCLFSAGLYAKSCEFKTVSFTTDFETGKLNSCAQLSEGLWCGSDLMALGVVRSVSIFLCSHLHDRDWPGCVL